jgi:hypothetical protein
MRLSVFRSAASIALLAAVFPGASLGGNGIQGDLKRVRENLEALGKRPRPASAADDERCEEAFTVAKLVQESPEAPLVITPAGKNDILYYFAYRALAEGSPKPCESLQDMTTGPRDGGAPPITEAAHCRTKYFELEDIVALVGRLPSRRQACLDSQIEGHGTPAEEAGRECDVWDSSYSHWYRKVPKPGEMRDWCRSTEKGADLKARLKCAPYGLAFFGDDGDCDNAGGGVHNPRVDRDDRLQCRSFAAFARSKLADDAGLCGGLDLCQALMGQSRQAGERAAQRLRWAFCGKRPPADAELSSEIWKSLGEIRADLAPRSAAASKLSLPPEEATTLIQQVDSLEKEYWSIIGAPRKPS